MYTTPPLFAREMVKFGVPGSFANVQSQYLVPHARLIRLEPVKVYVRSASVVLFMSTSLDVARRWYGRAIVPSVVDAE